MESPTQSPTLPIVHPNSYFPINRFPSPPPVPMPPFQFPLADGSASDTDLPCISVDSESSNSASSSRTSSRKNSMNGMRLDPFTPTHKRMQSRIVVPAITLTPPHGPQSLPILKSYAIDNPFLTPNNPPRRPSLAERPSLLSFASLSPSKRVRRQAHRSRRRSDEEEQGGDGEANGSIGQMFVARMQTPKRSFSMPTAINTALDWARSGTISTPNSPTKNYAASPAEVEKLQDRPSEAFSFAQLLSGNSSSLFSPPPSASGAFSFANLPARDRKASPPKFTARRRANKSPLLILFFPILVVALHIYFSFVDARFMHLGHDLIFGSPLTHHHGYGEGVHLDMHDAWEQFEEKISLSKRKFPKRGPATASAELGFEGDLEHITIAEEQNDPVAFLRDMQAAADRNMASH